MRQATEQCMKYLSTYIFGIITTFLCKNFYKKKNYKEDFKVFLHCGSDALLVQKICVHLFTVSRISCVHVELFVFALSSSKQSTQTHAENNKPL